MPIPMTIAFTSCMDARRYDKQPVWTEIAKHRPDALLLLGDQIYMDWGLRALHDESDQRVALDQDPSGQALLAFQADMHARYAEQWQVADFQQLVRNLVLQHGPGAIQVMWDDHDFAWNNAHGGGGPDRRPRYVRPEVAAVSRRLFHQFIGVLRHPPLPGGAYPAVPTVDVALQARRLDLGPVPFLLLDQRSHRTHIDHASPTLLGDAQAQALWATVDQAQGLLLLAGAVPMQHDRGRRERGWRVKSRETGNFVAYPEYDELKARVANQGHAVLYLAGDIHRTSYGGPIEPESQIVQVLASGAARGRKAKNHYGLIRLQGDGLPRNGSVDVELFQKDDLQEKVQLVLANGRWQTPQAGECTRPRRDGGLQSDVGVTDQAGLDNGDPMN